MSFAISTKSTKFSSTRLIPSKPTPTKPSNKPTSFKASSPSDASPAAARTRALEAVRQKMAEHKRVSTSSKTGKENQTPDPPKTARAPATRVASRRVAAPRSVQPERAEKTTRRASAPLPARSSIITAAANAPTLVKASVPAARRDAGNLNVPAVAPRKPLAPIRPLPPPLRQPTTLARAPARRGPRPPTAPRVSSGLVIARQPETRVSQRPQSTGRLPVSAIAAVAVAESPLQALSHELLYDSYDTSGGAESGTESESSESSLASFCPPPSPYRVRATALLDAHALRIQEMLACISAPGDPLICDDYTAFLIARKQEQDAARPSSASDVSEYSESSHASMSASIRSRLSASPLLDDLNLVRRSIISLDDGGEEPVFAAPVEWVKAFETPRSVSSGAPAPPAPASKAAPVPPATALKQWWKRVVGGKH